MSALDSLRYHVGANLIGSGVLRWQRLQFERKLANPNWWKHEHIAPPLLSSGRLKELISRHYLKGKFAPGHKKVAWITSGAPMEFLVALGYFPHYPENHGAMCGIRRMGDEMSDEAENAGWSRDICSYARTDFGAMLSNKGPAGALPRPDLLLCCTNICQTVMYWYRALAHHFDVPLIVIDTPFLYGEAQQRDLDYTKTQIEEAIATAERVAGRSLDPKKLDEATRLSKQATDLWKAIIESAQHRPAPITAFDQFICMAPIVEMRGEAFTVDFYGTVLDELNERKKKGIGAVKNERHRLVWDNLPIWFRIKWLAELLAERGVAMVASTYTNAWGELADMIDVANPLDSAARVHLHPILNRGTGHKLDLITGMVRGFEADGVILHSDRSCKPYSIGQVDQTDRISKSTGVAALLLEADHNDPRAFAEGPARNRLEAFLELLEDAA